MSESEFRNLMEIELANKTRRNPQILSVLQNMDPKKVFFPNLYSKLEKRINIPIKVTNFKQRTPVNYETRIRNAIGNKTKKTSQIRLMIQAFEDVHPNSAKNLMRLLNLRANNKATEKYLSKIKPRAQTTSRLEYIEKRIPRPVIVKPNTVIVKPNTVIVKHRRVPAIMRSMRLLMKPSRSPMTTAKNPRLPVIVKSPRVFRPINRPRLIKLKKISGV
jgi:hypothetical protein